MALEQTGSPEEVAEEDRGPKKKRLTVHGECAISTAGARKKLVKPSPLSPSCMQDQTESTTAPSAICANAALNRSFSYSRSFALVVPMTSNTTARQLGT
jgi:hypothetical protein